MIDVLFFASIREQLGIARLQLPADDELTTVDDLLRHLAAERGGNWQQVLLQDKVVKAVNQEVVKGDHPLADGDEVAFFPPVTGG